MKKSFFSTAAAAVLAGLLTLGVGCTVHEAQNASDTVKQTPQAVVSQEPEITSEITPAAIPETEPPSLPELEDVKVYATAPDTWLLTFSEDEILRNPESVQTVEASRAGEPLIFEFAGRKIQLSYDRTLLRGDASSNVLKYTVLHDGIAAAEERSTDKAAFFEDGLLRSLSLHDNPIALETEGEKDNASIRKAIEELLKDRVDFTQYEFCDIQDPSPDGGTTYTTFTWLNKKNGIPITTNQVGAWVEADGTLFYLYIDDGYYDEIDPKELPDDLSVERYMPHFEKKLYELYGDGLADYELAGAQISRINGSACLVVSFGIRTFGDAIGLAIIIE